MDDLPNLLQRDYGLKPQGKAAPMSTQRTTQARISGIPSVYDDVFGGPPKFTAPSFASQSQEGYDDIFRSFSTPIKNSSVPVFDAPVYDDDIFGGLKGIRNAAVPYDDVFSGGSAGGGLSSAPFEDLLRPKNSNSQRSGGNQGSSGFDDLITGFGNSEPANRTRSAGESRTKHRVPTASPRKPAEDPFVVLEPGLSSNSSSTLLPDSLEQLNMPSQPTTTSTKERKASSNGTMGIDKINAFDEFSITRGAASSPMNKSSIAKSPLKNSRGATPSRTSINTESVEGKSVKRTSIINNPVKDHSKAHTSVPRADIRKSSSKTDLSSKFSSPGRYRQPLHENSTYVSNLKRSSPPKKSERGANFVNEVLVTVGEVKLLTKPTPHPPPSRPPPPLVIKQGPSSKKNSKMSDFEHFLSGGSRVQVGGDPLSHCIDGKVDGSFAAAASTAAMKEAMERAEARMKQAKEARGNWEREVKAGKSQEREKQDRRDARPAEEIQEQEEKERVVKATRDAREQEDKEKAAKAVRGEKEKVAKAAREAREQEEHEREDHERERRQREKEREKEREREREREREKDRVAVERATQEARQRAERAAVERATAEARERAVAEARERAAAEARERVERAAVERAASEARERAATEARERAAAERAAVERAAAEARERAAAEARERATAEVKERAAAERAAAERAAAAVRERPASERAGSERASASADARLRAERAAVERANAEARERAAERAAVERVSAEARERAERAVAERAATAAKERQRRNDNDLESFFGMGARTDSAPRQRTGTSDATADMQSQNRGFSGEGLQRAAAGTPQSYRRSNLATNTADDWTSLFTAPSGEEFQEIPGETAERRRARLERHQRTLERAANALAQKNDRDLQAQREQAEKNRLAETLDADIKRWATGKEGNLRALLSTLQYILWPDSGWQPVSLTEVITAPSVKKVYRKATLCVHPDKVQQKGATIQQKYIAEKVFDLLKEAWNKFNSEELF